MTLSEDIFGKNLTISVNGHRCKCRAVNVDGNFMKVEVEVGNGNDLLRSGYSWINMTRCDYISVIEE